MAHAPQRGLAGGSGSRRLAPQVASRCSWRARGRSSGRWRVAVSGWSGSVCRSPARRRQDRRACHGAVGDDARRRAQAVIVGEAGLVDQQDRSSCRRLGRPALPTRVVAHAIQRHCAFRDRRHPSSRLLGNGKAAHRADEFPVADRDRPYSIMVAARRSGSLLLSSASMVMRSTAPVAGSIAIVPW